MPRRNWNRRKGRHRPPAQNVQWEWLTTELRRIRRYTHQETA